MQDPNLELNNLNDTTLQGLSLNRFLTKQNFNVTSDTMSPFQGIIPYLNNNNSAVYNNPINKVYDAATSIAPGTLISDSRIQTSSGGQFITGAPYLNGRVQLGGGFIDSDGNKFPYDSLTSFTPTGEASVIIWYGGIVLNIDTTSSFVPTVDYYINGTNYPQPISYGAGRVLGDGTATPNFPAGWTSVRNSLGFYTITPAFPLPANSYSVLLTPVGTFCTITAQNILTTSFDVVITDPPTGANVDSEFSFALFTTP